MDNGDSLLHLCVKNSLPHYICKYLIIHGVNINSQNNNGDTALHLAVQYHKYKTIDFLIKMGASEYIPNKMRKFCWECL
jgi:ankyrin repeat protein